MQKEETVRIQPKDSINFHLYNSYPVETNGMAKSFSIAEGTPFTFFLSIYDPNKWKGHDYFSDINFVFPDFDFTSSDFKDKSLAITLGREIVEMQYEYCGKPYPPNWIAKADITLAEEHHDQTMFLYVMDKIALLDPIIGGNAFYFMNGKDKIYMGECVSDLNQLDYSWALEIPTKYYSKKDLAFTFNIYFTDLEITDIRYNNYEGGGSGIHLFCKGADDALQLSDFEQLPLESMPSDSQALQEADIQKADIQKYGNFQVANEDGSVRVIQWYQGDIDHDGKSNILLFTSFPEKTEMAVDKILSETE